ncbi:MAG TPA: glycosyltransferase [Gemmatimonadaceae bacterium]|nr:glycosyltransferase [Gemmatimonadaceae bacterium]
MRVLHLAYTYFPDAVGGTEVYVSELVRELAVRGIDSVVAAPGNADAEYEHDGTRVVRYALGPLEDAGEVHDAAPNRIAVDALHRLFAREKPDVAHLHAYTRGVPLEAGDIARRHGARVVVTYHTPSVTCPIGTLMRDGTTVCDGALLVSRCARSMLRSHGAPALAAGVLGALPTAVGGLVGRLAPRAGGLATALRATHLMERRHARVMQHLRAADAVVAPSEWVIGLLVRLGLDRARLILSPQGIGADVHTVRRERPPSAAVRLLLPARYAPVKGIQVAVDAVMAVPHLSVALDVYGAVQGDAERSHRRDLEARASADSRIAFHDALEPAGIRERMAQADAVLIPSLWLETGPLTALEAFAAGAPVIGSDLGGIAERVRHGVDGMLVPPGDVAAWAAAIEQFSTDAALRARVTRGVRAPRRMADVAEEMVHLYGTVASGTGRSLKAIGVSP